MCAAVIVGASSLEACRQMEIIKSTVPNYISGRVGICLLLSDCQVHLSMCEVFVITGQQYVVSLATYIPPPQGRPAQCCVSQLISWLWDVYFTMMKEVIASAVVDGCYCDPFVHLFPPYLYIMHDITALCPQRWWQQPRGLCSWLDLQRSHQ